MHKRTAILALWLLALVGPMALQQAFAQGADPGASPMENLRARGAHRPGLWVQQGIARHQFGPEVSRSATPDPEYRLAILDELLRNLFAQLNALVRFVPGLLDPGTDTPGIVIGGGGGVNDVVITEIAHDGNVAYVELLNRSPLRLPLDGWVLAYGDLISPSLPPLELERNMSLVIQLGGDTQHPLADFVMGFRLQSVDAGELALYDFSHVSAGLLPIENPDLMIDYIQWNNEDRERDPPLESVAAAANLWTSIDAIPVSLANSSFRLDAGAEGGDSTSSRDFTVVDFAGGNTLGTPESQLTPGDLSSGDSQVPTDGKPDTGGRR